MNDDLHRQLDEFYRKLDGSARRVEARWKSTPANESRTVAAWLGAGVAAAAAILLMISALRSDPRPVRETVVRVEPPVETPVVPAPPPPPPPPVVPKPVPVERPRTEETPRVPEPRPAPPAPEEPRTPEPPAPPPPPPPSKREEPVSPTRPARAVAAELRETEGAFDLADKPLRGKQKDLTVKAGDRLRAATTVKLTLAPDRVVLLAPRSLVEFRLDDKRLMLALEQGDLIADLGGPGPELGVTAKTCTITPQGTVFAVKVDVGRVMVTVEKGRVDVQSPKGRANLRAAEALQASDDGSLGAPGPADFRAMAWARNQRAPETTLLADDFSKPGAWTGELDRGVIRAVAKPGSGAVLQLGSEKPPLFEVPVKGFLSLVCRSDRTGKFKVQLYSPDQKSTYTKTYIPVPRGDAWRTIVVDFDELVASDKSRPARLPPGSAVTDLLIMYGEEGEKGNFWVDAIRVTEVRP